MKKSQPKTFEARMERLQHIVSALEKGDLPLEQGVELYKEGMELSRACRTQLDKARHDIRVYTEAGLQPFASDAPQDEDSADNAAQEEGE